MTSLPITAAGAVDFKGMLTTNLTLRPTCPDCGQPLNPDGEGVRLRETEAGQAERICRPCFHGEIAEQLMAGQPGCVR